MNLQLAEGDNLKDYTFVPFNESTTEGAYVRNDVIKRAVQLVQTNQIVSDPGLSSFFGGLWKGIKSVVSTVVPLITGGGGNSSQPVIIQSPPPAPAPAPGGMDQKTMLLIGGGLLALLLIMKKK